jgi:LPS export ABC transporter protein LptC
MAFSQKRYRQRIIFSKALSAMVMMVLILWVSYGVFYIKDEPIEESYEHKAKPPDSISIIDSAFEGSDRSGKDYEITSKTLLKTGAGLYNLDTIAGRYYMSAIAIDLKARTGEMDDGKKTLKLLDDVVVEYSDYILKTNQMDVNLAKMSAKNNNEVSILYHHSNIRADRFEVDTDANTLHFEGHVLAHFKVSDF